LFLEQIATLLEARLPIDVAFRSLGRNSHSGYFPDMAIATAARLEKGELLSDILEEEDKIFNAFDIAIIRTSETSGDLVEGFSQLFKYHKKHEALRQKLRATFTYPAVLAAASLITIVILLTVVIPQFEPMLVQQKNAPPLITLMMLSSSHFLIAYGWIVFSVIIFLILYVQTPNGRKQFHNWIIKAPRVGSIVESIAIEQWSRGMALLLDRGIPLPKALELGAPLYNNDEMRRAGQRIAKQTAEGRQLTISMAEAGHFPDSIIQLTRIGEETGDLGIMFEKSADYLTTEIQSKLESIISILEPLIIIVLGGIVALVVIALMTTTMSLNLMVT
jgi:type IV pilus assembly protein PilC